MGTEGFLTGHAHGQTTPFYYIFINPLKSAQYSLYHTPKLVCSLNWIISGEIPLHLCLQTLKRGRRPRRLGTRNGDSNRPWQRLFPGLPAALPSGGKFSRSGKPDKLESWRRLGIMYVILTLNSLHTGISVYHEAFLWNQALMEGYCKPCQLPEKGFGATVQRGCQQRSESTFEGDTFPQLCVNFRGTCTRGKLWLLTTSIFPNHTGSGFTTSTFLAGWWPLWACPLFNTPIWLTFSFAL